MSRAAKRAAAAAIGLIVLMGAAAYALTRAAPRAETPLALDDDGTDGPTMVRDRSGRVIISNIRTVEPGVLYRGSGFPTSFVRAGGGTDHADETAFAFLRARNVRHVVALVDEPDTYYAEDGYLRYWSERTGFRIDTTWVPIDPINAFGTDDRGGLRAAGILIALMREGTGRGGAVYVHDLDGVTHVGVAAAGYELWRNRGWNDFDTTWALVVRRFLAGNQTMSELRAVQGGPDQQVCPDGQRSWVCREWLRSIRGELRFLIEL